jgi:hypothetical protein
MGLCDTRNPVDFTNACVRSAWGTLTPAVLVACFCATYVLAPVAGRVGTLKALGKLWETYLPLEDAQGLVGEEKDAAGKGQETSTAQAGSASVSGQTRVSSSWRTIVLVIFGLVETLFWLAIGCYLAVVPPKNVWFIIQPFLECAVWLYTVIRPATHPSSSPPFDVFTIYAIQLIAGTLDLGGVLFSHSVYGDLLPNGLTIAGMSVNLAVILFLLGVVFSTPMATPAGNISKAEIVSMLLCYW